MKLPVLGLLSILCVFGIITPASALTVPSLLDVPESFAYPRYSQLSQHRAQLKTRFGKLKAKIRAFRNSCASVVIGSSAASVCRGTKRKLSKKVAAYSHDAMDYNNRVRAALRVQCPRGGYETKRGRSAGREFVDCKCRFGFAEKGSSCIRNISAAILRMLPPFITREQNGDIRVEIVELNDAKLSLNFGFQGNVIKTGVNSYLKLNTLTGEELSIGMNTKLQVSSTQSDLMIVALQGNVRFKTNTKDSVFKGFQDKARRYFGKSRAWIKKARSRRFRVRTPNAVLAVRGTDFAMEGKDNGDLVVSVLNGGIDIRPLGGGRVLKLDAGHSALIPKKGVPRKLPPQKISVLAADWQRKSGMPVGR